MHAEVWKQSSVDSEQGCMERGDVTVMEGSSVLGLRIHPVAHHRCCVDRECPGQEAGL